MIQLPNSKDAEKWYGRGQALRIAGKRAEAKQCFEQALQYQADYDEAQLELGMIAHEAGDYETAEDFYRQVLLKQPQWLEVRYNLALMLRAQGYIQEALQCLHSVLSEQHREAHSQYLLTLHYDPNISAQDLYKEHRFWAETYTDRVPPCLPLPKVERKQRLKVGYLSANLRTHSVAYFLEALLESHNVENFEIFCYAHCLSPDGTTERLQQKVKHWRFITDLEDHAVAEQIRADGIDILIDLTGHTANTRLCVLAHRPAFLQGIYLGYPNTTGMSQIDFRLVDAWTDPPEQETFCTETLVRLEHGFLCYRPPELAPAVAPCPSIEKGYITFGSFNNLPKINEQVVALWAKVLHAVPNSRLLLKSAALSGKRIQHYYKSLFAKYGIPAERLQLLGRLTRVEDHLALYSQVDIALDPFPYNGTTTTCEALWMGVPVITLAGQSHVSRVGVSLLSNIGLQSWIAHCPEDYIERAVLFGQNLALLQEIRSNLRHKVETYLCDHKSFTQRIENTYQNLWEAKCNQYISDSINQGLIHQQLGNLEMALSHYEEVLCAEPHLAEIHSEIGFLLFQQGRLDEAIEHLMIADQLKPDSHQLALRLGICYRDKEHLPLAIQAFEQAILRCPDYADAFGALGIVLQRVGNLERAISCYEQAIILNPQGAENYNNLGMLLKSLGRYTEAISCYQKSLLYDKTLAETYSNLGNALLARGSIQDSVMAHRQALQVKSDFLAAHSNLLCALNYESGISAETLFAEHRKWAIQQMGNIAESTDYSNLQKSEKRLKIGYYSPDFRKHSVAYFIKPLLVHHDRENIEVFCYAQVHQPDQITTCLRNLVGHWRFTCGLSDEQVAVQIQEDEIDILVDLAGHTCNNRLSIFVRRPAPVQITYLGYPGTTGLAQIDYRLTDAWADPPDQELFYSEKLVRLEAGFLCYSPPEEAPEVAPPPYFEQGYITFGSFNNLPKINEIVVAFWSRILHAVPHSRLLLKSLPLSDLGIRDRYYMLFEKYGIAAERLVFYGYLQDDGEHLGFYNQVDIALDPFPYNGTTTTCEALWMGVPVITLVGKSHRSRVGFSILSQLNLQELIATSESEYVEYAVRLAHNPEQLIDFRSSIRFWMAASPLCDGEAFTRQLENTYRQLWQKWCENA